MLTAASLHYAQKWKVPSIPTMDEWLQKLMELAEMDKLTALIKEKKNTFISTWKPLLDFVLEVEKNESLILHFTDDIDLLL
uniref:Uncharacterized protein n=1 Tax=Laticauda laticaudata TaxID=8630 RepID=A0A8C5STB0_LATLA